MITKKGGELITRSRYETKYVQMLEADEDVRSFEYEPFEIGYEHEGIVKSYTPDFLVCRKERIELIEVKPSRFVTLERNPAKFKSAERFCIEEGFDFVIVTEEDLFNT